MQVEAARSAATLSRARYDGGVTSYLEVLDSERSLFSAEIAASDARRARLIAIVDLYKALGGGWTPDG
jgi:multidrug efflux system outer membrane protein